MVRSQRAAEHAHLTLGGSMDDVRDQDLDWDPDLTTRARQAALFGCLSMGAGMVGLCSCYLTFVVGVVLGALAIFWARQVKEYDPSGEALAYANVGWGTGLAGLIYSSLALLLVMAYLSILVASAVMGAL